MTSGVTSASHDGTHMYCDSTHLTKFGVIDVPLTLDALLDDVVSSLEFNTIELEDIFVVLTSFDIANNLSIYLIVIIVTVLDLTSITWLGCYRGHRRKLARQREGKAFEYEAREAKLKLLSDELKRLQAACRRSKQSLKRSGKLCAAETRGMLDKQAQLQSLTDVAATALRSAKGRAFADAVPASNLESLRSTANSNSATLLPVCATQEASEAASRLPEPANSSRFWQAAQSSVQPKPVATGLSRSRRPSREGNDRVSDDIEGVLQERSSDGGMSRTTTDVVTSIDFESEVERRALNATVAQLTNKPHVMSAVAVGLVVDILAEVTTSIVAEIAAEARSPPSVGLESNGSDIRPSPPASPPGEIVTGRLVAPSATPVEDNGTVLTRPTRRQGRGRRALGSAQRWVAYAYQRSILGRFVVWFKRNGSKLASTARKEHTLVGSLSPSDAPDALTPSQLLHTFWSGVMVELLLICFFHTPTCVEVDVDLSTVGNSRAAQMAAATADSDSGPQHMACGMGMMELRAIALVPALIEGLIAAVITAVIMGACLYAFRWGNSRVKPERSFLSQLVRLCRFSMRELLMNYRSLCVRVACPCFWRRDMASRTLPVSSAESDASQALGQQPSAASAAASSVFTRIATYPSAMPLDNSPQERPESGGSCASTQSGGPWADPSPRSLREDRYSAVQKFPAVEHDMHAISHREYDEENGCTAVLASGWGEPNLRGASGKKSREFDLSVFTPTRLRKNSRDDPRGQQSRKPSRDYVPLAEAFEYTPSARALSPPPSPPIDDGPDESMAMEDTHHGKAVAPQDTVQPDLCPLCLEPLAEQGTMEMPICQHVIHAHCALEMAHRCKNGTACPVCRKQHPELRGLGMSGVGGPSNESAYRLYDAAEAQRATCQAAAVEAQAAEEATVAAAQEMSSATEAAAEAAAMLDAADVAVGHSGSRAEKRAKACCAQKLAEMRTARAAAALKAAERIAAVARLASKQDTAMFSLGGSRTLRTSRCSSRKSQSRGNWGNLSQDEAFDLFEETTDSTRSKKPPSLLNHAPLPPPNPGRMPSLRGERISRAFLGRVPGAEDSVEAVKPKGRWAAISLGALVESTGAPGTEGPKLRSISELVDAAAKSHQEVKRRWRSYRETRARTAAAWAFNAFVYVGSALLALTYGVKFKSNSTNEMITVWMLAMLQVYLIIEPIQILVVVCLPNLCSKKTRCGRGCTKTWKVLNEIFRP